MCKFKEQRSQTVWMAIKLLGDDGPSAAAEQSECKVLTVGAWWGFDQMFFGGAEFLYFYPCTYSHIATVSLFSSSLDFVPSTLGYGFSRAGWCPHPLVPASSPTGVPALTLARFTHLLRNLENHFPNCGLLTVYNIGIWLECHFRKGDMDPFRKSVASESAHTLSGMCSVLPFLPSAGRIWDLLGWCYIFWRRCIKNGLIFFFFYQAPLLSCWGYLCRTRFKRLLFHHKLYWPGKIHAVCSKVCSIWK